MSYQSTHTGAEFDDAVGVAKGSGTGFVAKTATGTGAKRTITGSVRLSVTNGDGVAGDPALDFTQAVIDSLANADTAFGWGDHSAAGYLLSSSYTAADVKTKYESNADTNAYTDEEKNKLSGIEAGAEVNTVTIADLATKADLDSPALTGTPTAPTPATGNDSTLIATTAFVQNTVEATSSGISSVDVAAPIVDTGTASVPIIGISDVTITTSGAMLAADKVKIDGIESGATADQTATEIKTLYESNADTNAYTDSEKSLVSTAIQPGDPLAVPHVVVSASKTLALSDSQTEQQVDAAATITIPTNASVAYARGDKIAILSITTGTVTITADTGVTLNGTSAGSADLSGQYSGVVITKVGTDAWVINGDHSEVA